MYYRVEDKYLIYEDEIAYLKMCLSQVMDRDENGRDGPYLIRSVYFDDMADSAYLDNLSGVDLRSKFRIRTYNNDPSFIRLEEKSKRNGFTHKESALIGKETADGLIAGGGTAFDAPKKAELIGRSENFLIKKLYVSMLTNLLHPVTIVEYEREAFVSRVGNVRITFDMNISGCGRAESFFDNVPPLVPVLEKGVHVLEVKYDEMLPGHIKKLIDTGSFRKSAFSKYTMARQITDQTGDML